MASTVKPRNNPIRGLASSVSAALQAVKRCFRWVISRPRVFWALIARLARSLWYGAEVEEPKIVTHPRSFGRIIRKCWIHAPPIVAASCLAALNLASYFIGNEFQGEDGGLWQDFDQLALQVAAKIYELVIVASLATILMDILRYQLIFSSDGLPLGILTAKTMFVDAMYLFSPEFRMGIGGLSKRKKVFIGLSILTGTILSLIVGPASALLLIPKAYDDWAAGNASFYLAGTEESIWPSVLDAQSIGGSKCQSPSPNLISLQQLNMSSCVWSGYETIRAWWQASHLSSSLETILVQDGQVERNILLRYYSLGAGAFGITMAPCSFARVLSYAWRDAIFSAPNPETGSLSKYANYRFRQRGSSASAMNSEVPVVRTTCLTNGTVTFADIVNQTYFPLQVEYPSEYLAAQVAAGQPYDSGTVLGRQYSFDTPMYANSSNIAAIWLETPKDEPIGTRISGDNVSGRSSAYINIQIPQSNNSAVGFHAACSIDARWLQAQILGSGVGEVGSDVLYQTPAITLLDASVFPAMNNGKWRTVRLGLDWLNTLTPQLSNESSWNTLASIFTDAGFNNNTGLINQGGIGDIGGLGTYMGSVISSIVVDGMSRSGYENNGGGIGLPFVGPTDFPAPDSWSSILSGSYSIPPVSGEAENATDIYKMGWSVTITGLGYRANSTTYYLALAVLFVYLALAWCHIIWVICCRESSKAWGSLTDLITLALVSTPPSSALDHASVSIERSRTFREPIRIRAIEPTAANSSQSSTAHGSDGVEITLGADYSPGRHKKVVRGVLY